jgi:hypothetical protein
MAFVIFNRGTMIIVPGASIKGSAAHKPCTAVRCIGYDDASLTLHRRPEKRGCRRQAGQDPAAGVTPHVRLLHSQATASW